MKSKQDYMLFVGISHFMQNIISKQVGIDVTVYSQETRNFSNRHPISPLKELDHLIDDPNIELPFINSIILHFIVSLCWLSIGSFF